MQRKQLLVCAAAVIWWVFSALVGGVYAQSSCPGGICRNPSIPLGDSDAGWRPQQGGNLVRVTKQIPDPAVVRIKVEETTNVSSWGSGVLVAVDGNEGLILSCAHNFREQKRGGTIMVVFPDRSPRTAELLGVEAAYDVAALRVAAPAGVRPHPLASDAPPINATCIAAGFGSGDYRAFRGPVKDYGRNNGAAEAQTLTMQGAARSGDSGGPIFNERGELAAIVFGSDGASTYGTCCLHLGDFCQRLRARCGNRGQQSGAPKPLVSVRPGPVSDLRKGESDGGSNVADGVGGVLPGDAAGGGDLRARLADFEKRIADFEAQHVRNAGLPAIVERLRSDLDAVKAGGALGDLPQRLSAVEHGLPELSGLKTELASKFAILKNSNDGLAEKVGHLKGLVDAIPEPVKLGALQAAEAAAPGILSTLGLASGPAGLAVSLALALMHRGLSKKIDNLTQQQRPPQPWQNPQPPQPTQQPFVNPQSGGPAAPANPFPGSPNEALTNAVDFGKQLIRQHINEKHNPVLDVTKGRVYSEELESRRLTEKDPVAVRVIDSIENAVAERLRNIHPQVVPT